MSNGKVNEVKNKTDRHANKLAQHPVMVALAKVGFVVSGLLHIMIGWIAFKVATGSGGGEASNSGAMAQIAQNPGGQILLWAMTIGLAALGLWRLLTIVVASETKDKLKGAALGVVFLGLAVSASKFAMGGSSSDSQKTTSVTSSVLEMPGGKILIAIAGLVVIGIGVYGIYKGATRKFKEELEAGTGSGKVGSAITVAGTVGNIARGIAFLVLGGLVIWAAFTSDPQKAAGMDSALRTIGSQPFGAILLILMAVGFALYGIYSIARAKYTNEV